MTSCLLVRYMDALPQAEMRWTSAAASAARRSRFHYKAKAKDLEIRDAALKLADVLLSQLIEACSAVTCYVAAAVEGSLRERLCRELFHHVILLLQRHCVPARMHLPVDSAYVVSQDGESIDDARTRLLASVSPGGWAIRAHVSVVWHALAWMGRLGYGVDITTESAATPRGSVSDVVDGKAVLRSALRYIIDCVAYHPGCWLPNLSISDTPHRSGRRRSDIVVYSPVSSLALAWLRLARVVGSTATTDLNGVSLSWEVFNDVVLATPAQPTSSSTTPTVIPEHSVAFVWDVLYGFARVSLFSDVTLSCSTNAEGRCTDVAQPPNWALVRRLVAVYGSCAEYVANAAPLAPCLHMVARRVNGLSAGWGWDPGTCCTNTVSHVAGLMLDCVHRCRCHAVVVYPRAHQVDRRPCQRLAATACARAICARGFFSAVCRSHGVVRCDRCSASHRFDIPCVVHRIQCNGGARGMRSSDGSGTSTSGRCNGPWW